jgi:hypothetical protein
VGTITTAAADGLEVGVREGLLVATSAMVVGNSVGTLGAEGLEVTTAAAVGLSVVVIDDGTDEGAKVSAAISETYTADGAMVGEQVTTTGGEEGDAVTVSTGGEEGAVVSTTLEGLSVTKGSTATRTSSVGLSVARTGADEGGDVGVADISTGYVDIVGNSVGTRSVGNWVGGFSAFGDVGLAVPDGYMVGLALVGYCVGLETSITTSPSASSVGLSTDDGAVDWTGAEEGADVSATDEGADVSLTVGEDGAEVSTAPTDGEDVSVTGLEEGAEVSDTGATEGEDVASPVAVEGSEVVVDSRADGADVGGT